MAAAADPAAELLARDDILGRDVDRRGGAYMLHGPPVALLRKMSRHIETVLGTYAPPVNHSLRAIRLHRKELARGALAARIQNIEFRRILLYGEILERKGEWQRHLMARIVTADIYGRIHTRSHHAPHRIAAAEDSRHKQYEYSIWVNTAALRR